MKHPKRLAVLLGLAIAATAGAYALRQRILSSPQFALKQALRDPRYKNLDSSVAALQAAVQASPNDPKARWKLADMYQKLQLLDLAREQVEQICKLTPSDPTPAVALANIHLALRHDKAAEDQYRAVTKQWPKVVAGWQGLAAVLYRQERYTECLEATGKALNLEPKSKNTRFILGSALLQYAREFPSPEMYAPYVRVARKEFEDLLPAWPDPAEIHYRLGSAYSILRNNDKAIEHLAKAVELQPTRAHFVVALVDAYLGAGKREDARKTIDAAYARNIKTALLLDREGQVAQADATPAGYSKAVDAFARAVQMEPSAAVFHEHLGSALIRAGKLDLARQEFEQAAKLNPERPFSYQQLSALYTRLGDTARATAAAKMATRMVFNEQQLRHFEQLSAAYPEDVNLHLVIADRYRDLKMVSAARDKYRLVLRIDPGNRHAQQEVAKLAVPSPATSGG